jgi:2-amino-4-hydroxy-6-hydroxymethyldihydropteridine diphosphokinase
MPAPAHWIPAYVAIGSNLDDPVLQVRTAIEALARLPDTRRIAVSRLYRTAPMGPHEQPDFINAAAALLTQLPAAELLAGLQDIERRQGRVRPAARWGPRRIDLDLLACGEFVSTDAGLTLPHPGVPHRAFVLYPLAEIAPDAWIVGHGRVLDLARRLSAQDVQPVE